MSSCGNCSCDKPPVSSASGTLSASANGQAGTSSTDGDDVTLANKPSNVFNSSQRKCLRASRPASLGSQLEPSGGDIGLSGAASGDGSQRPGVSASHSVRGATLPTQPNISHSLTRTLMKTWGDAYGFWRKVRDDHFRWGLFKSILFFTVGLKLFDDLARHLASPPHRCGR